MKKTNAKKGFTLAELLIVIAIIVVLVGIAIPVFGNIVEKANIAADEANLRSDSVQYATAYMDGSTVPVPTTIPASGLDFTLKSSKYNPNKKSSNTPADYQITWDTNSNMWKYNG